MTAPDFQFDLPSELIAQEPAARRGDARLLLVEPGQGPVGERAFRDLPGLLRPGDLLVLNESRVLPARLFARRADTGGRVEVLLVAPQAAA
ncbi:MAG: S-adenosylmethionine:tRNA ribosyltransferase-isomerase, partial [Krumholzibacteria bacterium]|nr:S-adenosylmethionine:tRNA ribosyltransferase-isomerase [Candidatus Krumholzibacteria bacterium]